MSGDRQVAVITGGGRGLGRAVAERLADDGLDVAVLARSQTEVAEVADGLRRAGVRALGLSVDVTSTAAMDDAQARVATELGDVHVLVNNAGNLLYKPFIPLPGLTDAYPGFDTPTSDEEWDGVLDVHLGGTVRALRAFVPGMLERGDGRVVNVVSNVVRRTVPFTTAYDTAKGGIAQLTRSLAREWGRYGVTVNAVAAGHFPTEMSRAQLEDPTSLAKLLRRVPLRRVGEPEEFASLVAYLCSDAAAYVTGELIGIDGGETL